MAWPAIGKAFTPAEFATYVQGLSWSDAFRPQFITLHNTASPCLANRPDGLTRQHIANLEGYYKSTCKWNGGPHLFIDDKQIWVFNDLTKRGTHSPSFNATAIGIEMLGDFDTEEFNSGRGRKVRDNTVAAMAILNNKLGFAADGFKFHIEDKKSDHACPGKKARSERDALVAEIAAAMTGAAPAVADDAHADSVPLDVDATQGVTAIALPSPKEMVASSRKYWLIERVKIWLFGGGIATLIGGKEASSAGVSDPMGLTQMIFAFVKDHGVYVAIGTLIVGYLLFEVIQHFMRQDKAEGRYTPSKEATP